MSLAAVHQFHPIASPGDAVTNGMFLARAILRGLGFDSHIYAQHVHERLVGDVLSDARLRPRATTALLVHHSHGHEREDWLRDLPVRQFLVYHNITPARFFAPGSLHHHYSLRGREMLTRFRAWMPAALCDSTYNAAELLALGYSDLTVLPLLFDLDTIRAPHPDTQVPAHPDAFHLLFVGRIASNKCQHDLLLITWYLKQLMDRPVRLVLVGSFEPDEPYSRYLAELSHLLGLKDEVILTGHVSPAALWAWYQRADVFACMSEHEGFGVPLVEAMALDKPVVAFGSSSVPDTLGPGGVVIARKEHARIAAVIKALHKDHLVREALRQGRATRLAEFARSRLEADLSGFLAAHGVTPRLSARAA